MNAPGGRMGFFVFVLLLSLQIYSADINCSGSYVSSLPACSWDNACSSQSYCFHGEYGIWGNVYRCHPGGYYDTSAEFSWQCATWLDDSPDQPGTGTITGGDNGASVIAQSNEVLVYTLIGVVFLLSFVGGFISGSR